MFDGHDWTLKSIQYEWAEARAVFIFETDKAPLQILVATGVADLKVPQKRQWGPSVRVNKISTPTDQEGGLKNLSIEMQSGDIIRVEAVDFRLELA